MVESFSIVIIYVCVCVLCVANTAGKQLIINLKRKLNTLYL